MHKVHGRSLGEKIVDDGNYEGDVNQDEDACGWGICKTLMGHTYKGTMKEDKYHGYGRCLSRGLNFGFVRGCHLEERPENPWRNENGQKSWEKYTLPVS